MTYREDREEEVRDKIVVKKRPLEKKRNDMENSLNTVEKKHRISNENSELLDKNRKISKDYGEYFSVEIFENDSELAVVKHIDNDEDGKTLLDMQQRQN